MDTYLVQFKYADEISNWEWREQQCTVFAKDETHAVRKCVELYGLGIDCKYKIINIMKVR